MILSLSESPSFLAGAGWAGPGIEAGFDSVIRYLESAWPMWCLFLIGIFLGALFFGRRKSSTPATDSASLEEAPAEAETEAPADDSELQQQIGEMNGELAAARQLGEGRLEELEALRRDLDSAHRRLGEQQNRFVRLSDSLKQAASHSGGQASLANARAPVIYLNEVVRSERQHLDDGLARLQHLEERLNEESLHVWHCAEAVAAIHRKISKKTPQAEAIIEGIGAADEQLRVFHQNVQGCLQRIAISKSRLQSDAAKLEEAAGPIAEAEAELAKLAAIEDRADGEAIETAFAAASARLSESRPVVDSLENGIDQELAEMTGRIDWVVKDSPKNFFKLLEELSECEPVADPLIDEQVAEIWQLLTEAKGVLVGIELAPDAGGSGEPEPGFEKLSIVEALDRAAQTLESAAIAPPDPAESTGAEKTIAGLEKQLAQRERQTARLARELKVTSDQLIQLRDEMEERQDADEVALRSDEEAGGGKFVRQLLGLGPGEESTGFGQSSEISASSPAATAVTFTEAREILGELKLASTNGSGNGGPPASEPHGEGEAGPPANADSREQEEKDSELDHLRKTAASQQSRIDELEKTIVELRETIPLKFPPAPTIIQADQLELPIENFEKPGLIEGVTPGHQVDAGNRERVIFRGDDLSSWDSDYRGPNDRLATPLEHLPEDIRYLRMRRLDTGDSVVIPITRQELLDGASTCGLGCGWSGRRERYFGSDHIGIFDQSLPREVETKFGAGGWGFGHVEDISSRQAYGWAGLKINPTDFEISVGTGSASMSAAEPAEAPRTEFPEPGAGIIIFRGNHPETWDQNTYAGANSRSRLLADLPDDIAWLRIRRLPGGESVILPVTKDGLSGNGDGLARGFNGSNEHFYGARHLGAFDEALPQEVETRFTYGGWGFGHRPMGEEKQASSWAGRKIDVDTVFEMIVYGEMPEVDGLLDRVLKT